MAVILPHERWRKLEAVFTAALELPAPQRDAFIARECAADPSLAAEVRALLQNDSEADADVAGALAAGAADMVADPLIGTRIGAWRVERQLGRGGMGVVYLVTRANGEFQQRAALKVIKRGMDTAAVVERMRRERRILASLNHPYIGRLLDGGATVDGLPYFVMEYVEGLPIDQYCDRHRLSIAQRCAVFQKVCEAVAYAHRSLVVHRDLKPTNILVTADGSPKLLDFGIAKVIRGEDGPTDTVEANWGGVPLTPEYASPEQLRGEPVTTASDVYSLAAVLYRLLAGCAPQRLEGRSTAEAVEAICREEPEKPSAAALREGKSRSWSERLAGDLDTIVLMGLRKEPERRYLSPGRLHDDVARHFNGLPVEAREDTLWYRAGKFLRRNRVAMIAAGLLALTLAAGIAATLWQARRAGRQRALAEQRLAVLLDLANRSLFDIHDEIARVPGTTETRKHIAASTLEYLNKLKAQAGSDPRMLLVLSQAYRRLGDVEGDPFSASLGDTAAALASYREAKQLSEQLLDLSPGEASLSEWWEAAGRVASSNSISRVTSPEAFGIWNRAERLMEMQMQVHPTNNLAVQLATVHERFAHQWAFTQPAVALDHALREIALLEPVTRSQPGDDGPIGELGVAYTTVGRIHNNQGQFIEAAAYFRKAIAVHESRARKHPAESIRRDLSISYTDLANLQYFSERPNLGDWRASLELYRQAVQPREAVMAADPADLTARRDVAFLTMRIGCRMLGPEMAAERRATLQRTEALFDDLIAHDPHNRDYRRQLGENMVCLGDAWRQAADPARALAAYDKGDAQLKTAGIDRPGPLQGRALALAAAGRSREAQAAARSAAEEAERNLQGKAPVDSARIWAVRLWLTLGEVSQAAPNVCEALRRAQAAWDSIPPANRVGFAADRARMEYLASGAGAFACQLDLHGPS